MADPTDFYDSQKLRAPTPYHRLWLAVLEDAIRLARLMPTEDDDRKPWRSPGVCADARSWIASDSYHVGSFRWCCDLFELDPNAAVAAVTASLTRKITCTSGRRSRVVTVGRRK